MIRQYCYFSVRSETLSAVDMAGLVGMEPDETLVMGSRSSERVLPRCHAWKIVRRGDEDVETQIRHVVDRLTPVRAELVALCSRDDVDAVVQVVREYRSPGEMPVAAGPEADAPMGWGLDTSVLEFLCATGARLDVDEYDFVDDRDIEQPASGESAESVPTTVASQGAGAADLRRLAGLATPMALRVAVTLGLPDRLRHEAATTRELAAELEVSERALDSLLGHLEHLEVVRRTPTGFLTTTSGRELCATAEGGFTDLLLRLDSAAGRAELAFVELAHSVATGEAAYPRRYGRDFWADLADDPHLRASFDRQMDLRFVGQIPQIVAGYDWSRFRTLVDVGGGRGRLLAALLAAHPAMRAHLLDLAPTAAEARRVLDAAGVGERAEVSALSFFDPLPPGNDAYLLCDILHDWDDEHAHRILARCAEAAAPDGAILVVEPVGGRRAGTDMDLSMLVIHGGRERRIEEFRSLGQANGLDVTRAIDVSDQRCLLEYRRTPGKLPASGGHAHGAGRTDRGGALSGSRATIAMSSETDRRPRR